MALADTAKLVASLTLEDKFSGPLGRAGTALGGFEAKTSTLSRVGGELSRGLGAAANNLKLIGIAGAGLLAVNVKAGIDSLQRLQDVETQTNAVLQSTQGVAGQTAESIRNLAEKYEGLNATIDDKVIQSGENLLLTFTNIPKQAFEPALEAALNLNQALGGGEEGLQGTIIQLGKALNDPIKGLTALRRVGVSFTADQQAKIKSLVAENKTYEAQQIILGELTKEFGGSFAAAGQTATGQFAKFSDSIEDAQAALATAFLPLLGKVAGKLSTFLRDPATLQRIEDFGTTLASGFDKILEAAGKIDFGAIGQALTIAGTGAKAVFDAFTSLPPWIQTAVLTGWGLNKLTGGALGNIVGILGQGLIKGVLGMNAGVVNINAATVNGGLGGVPGAAGAGRGPLTTAAGGLFKFVLGPAAAVIIGSEIAAAINAPVIKPAQTFEEGVVKAKVDSADLDTITTAINGISDQRNTKDPLAAIALGASYLPFIGDALGHVGPELEAQFQEAIRTRHDLLAALPPKTALTDIDQTIQKLSVDDSQEARDQIAALEKQRTEIVAGLAADKQAQDTWGARLTAQAAAITGQAAATRLAVVQADAVQRGQNNAILAAAARAASSGERTAAESANIARYTGIDAAKPPPSFHVTIPVTAVANINVNGFLRTVTSAWIASASGGAGPALDPTKLY